MPLPDSSGLATIPAALAAYFANIDSTAATQDAAIGTAYIAGGTDVPVADGGTGASDAATARTNLGLGSAAVAELIDDDTMATATATNVPSAESVKAYVDSSSPSALPWFYVTDYGADPTGTSDSTTEIQAAIDAAATAGGGVVFFPAGVYVVGGALQDGTRSNAQLLLPRIDAVDSEQVTIVLRGEYPPPPVMSVVGATPIPDNHSVIKGTLNAGAGGALLGAWGPVGTFDDFTFVNVQIEDLTFRLPSNPVLTALNLSKVTAVDIDNVVVDCGNYYVEGLTEPTTNTSVGIQCPANNNGAYTRLGAVNVIGFYHGYTFGEHTVGQQVAAWGCKQGARFLTATNHASYLQRFMAVHCEIGIAFAAYHPVKIAQYDIEHATAGWWVTDYDIDDASNYGVGEITWHTVLAGTGPDDTFTVNGGGNLFVNQLGRGPSLLFNAQTGTSYTPTVSDNGRLVTLNNAAAITVTLPQDSAAKIPVGGQIHFTQLGAGQVTFAAGTGATVNSTPGLDITAQYGTVTAIKRAANTWLLIGALA